MGYEVMTRKTGWSKLSFSKTGQAAGRVACCCFRGEGETRVPFWTFLSCPLDI